MSVNWNCHSLFLAWLNPVNVGLAPPLHPLPCKQRIWGTKTSFSGIGMLLAGIEMWSWHPKIFLFCHVDKAPGDNIPTQKNDKWAFQYNNRYICRCVVLLCFCFPNLPTYLGLLLKYVIYIQILAQSLCCVCSDFEC